MQKFKIENIMRFMFALGHYIVNKLNCWLNLMNNFYVIFIIFINIIQNDTVKCVYSKLLKRNLETVISIFCEKYKSAIVFEIIAELNECKNQPYRTYERNKFCGSSKFVDFWTFSFGCSEFSCRKAKTRPSSNTLSATVTYTTKIKWICI